MRQRNPPMQTTIANIGCGVFRFSVNGSPSAHGFSKNDITAA